MWDVCGGGGGDGGGVYHSAKQTTSSSCLLSEENRHNKSVTASTEHYMSIITFKEQRIESIPTRVWVFISERKSVLARESLFLVAKSTHNKCNLLTVPPILRNKFENNVVKSLKFPPKELIEWIHMIGVIKKQPPIKKKQHILNIGHNHE